MLPSWRNRFRIVLCPDKVIILGLGKGLRPKVILKTILPCTPLAGAPNWQPALGAFEQWLGTNEIGKAVVTVILSNHFVRYALMPFSEDVASRAEEHKLAQILFEGIYGELSKQWKLSISDGGYGQPRLAAAVDTMLLDRIAGIMEAGKLRLSSITPYLSAAFNSFHAKINVLEGLFAVAEPGQMAVIAFRNGQLSGVRRMPLNGGSNEQLLNLLQREVLTGGFDTDSVPVFLHVAGQPDIKPQSESGMTVHPLRHLDKHGDPLVEDGRFDMASLGSFA